jgi:hypothetical protein
MGFPLTDENLRIIEANRRWSEMLQTKPEAVWPFLKPCTVRLLLVADGTLDFSEGDFGLSTFVRTLLDMPGRYVRFEITLAHLSSGVSDLQLMEGEERIARRISGFKFDVTDHFGSGLYDEVMLFGFQPTMPDRGDGYPDHRLANNELNALAHFMNGGGGLFATGDHGELGRFLCHAVPRARNMRLWKSTPEQRELDEVSMTGRRRNDTNRWEPSGQVATFSAAISFGSELVFGSAGSRFDDQSDDTPQVVQPRLYQVPGGWFGSSFPHPLLCGPNGVIRVMPDHPHEGECIEPSNTDQTLVFGEPDQLAPRSDSGPEYPDATDGGPRPLPEVISTSTVLSGTESHYGSTTVGKEPTDPHSFGGISAYDGHRAGVGRVVTDATWHHFVNVNLIGQLMPDLPPSNPKSRSHPGGGGFLATAVGRFHLEEIRTYYRNLAVWLAPPPRIDCMNTRLLWAVLWDGRILEAVLSAPNLSLTEARPHILESIGSHARDVLGQHASRCQGLHLVLRMVLQPAMPKLIDEIDPWLPKPPTREQTQRVKWFDATPLLDISLGAALLGLRNALPEPDEHTVAQLETQTIMNVVAEAGRIGLQQALQSAIESTQVVNRFFEGRAPNSSSDEGTENTPGPQ